MEQFVLIPYSVYQSQSTLPIKQQLEQKQEKEKVVIKCFDSAYSAVINARLKKNNNKHLIDSILNSPISKLSQSDNIILDNRDTKESMVDFVCAPKRKTTNFPDIYFTILEAAQLPPNLLLTRIPKQKTKELGSLSKFEKLRLN